MAVTQQEPDSRLSSIYRLDQSPPRTLMIAHRCGAGLGPENTRGTVVQSSHFRPDYYEIDIRHTKDSIPVAIHDETLDRTTNLSGTITEMTWDEIVDADAGSWYGSFFTGESIPPTFERILDSVNPSPLCIELKEPGITRDQCLGLVEILDEKNDASSIVFSFHQTALDTFRSVDTGFQSENSDGQSETQTMRRTGYLSTSVDEYALNGPHEIVGLLHDECTYEIVEQIHQSGKAVWVWTVNDPVDMSRLVQMEVDGIITDYPDRLRKILPPS